MEFATLNNGVKMPMAGIGTFLLTPDEAEASVLSALACGYRLIDTANAYVNEKAVGRAMKKSGVDRKDIFLETKLWPAFYEQADAVDKTLERLGTDYIDLLLHYDGLVNGSALDPDYVPDELDSVSADAAACGMIYAFYGRLGVGSTDVEALRAGDLPPTFYCYGTQDPFYRQFLANADAVEAAGVPVERLELEGMPHGFGVQGGWLEVYDNWLNGAFHPN